MLTLINGERLIVREELDEVMERVVDTELASWLLFHDTCVGVANLFFLPLAGKMRIQLREDYRLREMILEGVISTLEGMNPRMLEIKLAGSSNQSKRP
jgi:hypothetical protein